MQKAIHFLAITVTAVVGLCVLYLQPFPVLHDYPEWMYQGWLAYQLVTVSDGVVASQFALTNYPVPNSLGQFSIAVLNAFVSPIVAGKIWLAIYLGYASALWFLLSRQVHRGQDGSINLILTMTFTFGPGFWNGYVNFQFALLFFATYLLLIRLQRDGKLLHLLLSLLIFFSHASVYMAFIMLVAARVLFRQSNWRNLVAVVPSLILLVWYVLESVQIDALGTVNALGLSDWLQYKVYTVAKQGYFHNFILADGSSLLDNAHAVYIAGMALNLLVALVMVAWLKVQSWQLLRSMWSGSNQNMYPRDSYQHREYRAIFVVLLGLLILFLLAGKNNLGVVNLGERFLIAALLLGITQLRCHQLLRNVWVTLAVVGAAFTMASVIKITSLPVEEYADARSTTSATLDAAIGDIYANSRHKYFNHRLYIYADHGLWLMQPDNDLQQFKHNTSIVVPR